MAISVHRPANITMPRQNLGRLGSDVGPAEIGDERVPQGMKVCETALRILILEKVGRFSFLAFLLALGLGDISTFNNSSRSLPLNDSL